MLIANNLWWGCLNNCNDYFSTLKLFIHKMIIPGGLHGSSYMHHDPATMSKFTPTRIILFSLDEWRITCLCKLVYISFHTITQSTEQGMSRQTSTGYHARLVRLPTSIASSVSTFKEMSNAFTECVNAPLSPHHQNTTSVPNYHAKRKVKIRNKFTIKQKHQKKHDAIR